MAKPKTKQELTQEIAHQLYLNRQFRGMTDNAAEDWAEAERILKSRVYRGLFRCNQWLIWLGKRGVEPLANWLDRAANLFRIFERLSPVLQVLGAIAIPVMLSVAAHRYQDNQRQQELVRLKQQKQQELEQLNQQAVKEYLARLSEVLLQIEGRDLHQSENERVRVLMTATTLVLLQDQNLDGQRKGQVIEFLNEMALVQSKGGEKGQVISLEDANLEGANFEGANLEGVHLRGANLMDANLRGANLMDASLGGANLGDASLGADLGADLWGADLRGANLMDAKLWGANLMGADIRSANLRGANLGIADLRGAKLWDADLRGADLKSADLRGAKLWDADLRGAFIRDADLEGADLEGADLGGADLGGADLEGADLEGADLEDANLRATKLKVAIWTDGLLCLKEDCSKRRQLTKREREQIKEKFGK